MHTNRSLVEVDVTDIGYFAAFDYNVDVMIDRHLPATPFEIRERVKAQLPNLAWDTVGGVSTLLVVLADLYSRHPQAVDPRTDGVPTKWTHAGLTDRQKWGLDRTEYHGNPCDSCGAHFYTEGDFARHFVLPQISLIQRTFNLGECPNSERGRRIVGPQV